MKRKNSLKNSRKRIIQATVAAVAGITVAVAAFRPVETSANGVLPGVESIVAQKMACWLTLQRMVSKIRSRREWIISTA